MSLRRFAVVGLVVAMAFALPFAVEAGEGKGKVMKLDSKANVVIFEDGSMYRVAPDTVILVEEKPVKFDTLEPGAMIVIRSGEAVQLKDGQYIVISPSASPASR
jgi:hypothetical protein